MTRASHFEVSLFSFLKQLERHNDRGWFADNKQRYQRDVRDPLLRFITDAAEPLQTISEQIIADPRPVGGSMFRIYRDTRFSKDKTPYKTHAAAHFRHRAKGDVHAPGFYLHLEPGKVFGGAGIWHPDGPSLTAIRNGIMENSKLWKKITGSRALRASCNIEGASLKRAPRGIDPEHPMIEDLKRKDFVVVTHWSQADALRPDFLKRFARFCRTAAPFNEFLSRSLGLDW